MNGFTQVDLVTNEISRGDVLVALVAGLLAGIIICYLFVETWIDQLQDHIHDLNEIITEASTERYTLNIQLDAYARELGELRAAAESYFNDEFTAATQELHDQGLIARYSPETLQDLKVLLQGLI